MRTLALFLSVFNISCESACERGWTRSRTDGRCYKQYQESMSWYKAKYRCIAYGGRLQEGVEGLNLLHLGNQAYWIGANDLAQQEKWVWSSMGNPVTEYEYFTPDYKQIAGDCLLVEPESALLAPRDCGQQHGYICEKDGNADFDLDLNNKIRIDAGGFIKLNHNVFDHDPKYRIDFVFEFKTYGSSGILLSQGLEFNNPADRYFGFGFDGGRLVFLSSEGNYSLPYIINDGDTHILTVSKMEKTVEIQVDEDEPTDIFLDLDFTSMKMVPVILGGSENGFAGCIESFSVENICHLEDSCQTFGTGRGHNSFVTQLMLESHKVEFLPDCDLTTVFPNIVTTPTSTVEKTATTFTTAATTATTTIVTTITTSSPTTTTTSTTTTITSTTTTKTTIVPSTTITTTTSTTTTTTTKSTTTTTTTTTKSTTTTTKPKISSTTPTTTTTTSTTTKTTTKRMTSTAKTTTDLLHGEKCTNPGATQFVLENFGSVKLRSKAIKIDPEYSFWIKFDLIARVEDGLILSKWRQTSAGESGEFLLKLYLENGRLHVTLLGRTINTDYYLADSDRHAITLELTDPAATVSSSRGSKVLRVFVDQQVFIQDVMIGDVVPLETRFDLYLGSVSRLPGETGIVGCMSNMSAALTKQNTISTGSMKDFTGALLLGMSEQASCGAECTGS